MRIAADACQADTWGELCDCLQAAHLALQALEALMDLAELAGDEGKVQVQGLHALLQGPLGQLEQAHAAMHLLRRRPVPCRPPAHALDAGTCCWHDAQGLVEGT